MKPLFHFTALLLVCVRVGADTPPSTRAFIEKHCIECHDADKKKGSLDLTALDADFQNITQAETWLNVMDQLNSAAILVARSWR